MLSLNDKNLQWEFRQGQEDKRGSRSRASEPQNTKYKVMEVLSKFGGEFKRYQFTKYGLKTWVA